MTTETTTSNRVRAARVADWMGWHTPELAALAVPTGAAVWVSPWLWLLAAAVAAAWVTRSARQAARHRRLRAVRAQITTGTETAASGRDVPGAGNAEAREEVSA